MRPTTSCSTRRPYENAADPEIKAFLAFVKDNKAESDLTRETGLSAEIVVTL